MLERKAYQELLDWKNKRRNLGKRSMNPLFLLIFMSIPN